LIQGQNPSPIVTTPSSGAPPKAWATVATKDEPKTLKEIQEAEAKLAKEKEALAQKSRPAPVSATSSGPVSASKDDETASTLLTWGLPTSHAGARAPSSISAGAGKEGSSPAPVWANAAKSPTIVGAKRTMTMKDIQEEEERRKKKEKEPTATTARRVVEAQKVSDLAVSLNLFLLIVVTVTDYFL
jgi:hypothetical protein